MSCSPAARSSVRRALESGCDPAVGLRAAQAQHAADMVYACSFAQQTAGATKPSDAAPGTIRGDYCIDVGRNVIHGSDAVESAEKEIALSVPDGMIRSHWFLTLHAVLPRLHVVFFGAGVEIMRSWSASPYLFLAFELVPYVCSVY